MKQCIDSKGLFSAPFSHEDHINGDGSLLEPRYTPTRAELIQLAQHYSSEVADYRDDRERFPEDGISSREYNRYVYALRRLGRIETLLAEAPVYEGMEEATSNLAESVAPEKENTDADHCGN
jgi:hypothetical protein